MIVSKDEDLKLSMPYVGYLILKALRAAEGQELSFIDAMKVLRKAGVTQSRAISFGLVFLHTLGSVEFSAPYLRLVSKKEGSK